MMTILSVLPGASTPSQKLSVAKRTLSVNGRATAWDLDARGQLGLRVFVDRVGLEIFSCDGLQYLPLPEIVPDPAKKKLSWRAGGAKKPVRTVIERAWRLTKATE